MKNKNAERRCSFIKKPTPVVEINSRRNVVILETPVLNELIDEKSIFNCKEYI